MVAIVALPPVLGLNYRSTLALTAFSHALIGLVAILAAAGMFEVIRRESNPQTGFSSVSNLRRDRPARFFWSTAVTVAAVSAVAAAGTWYSLSVAVPHVSGLTLSAAGTVNSIQTMRGGSVRRFCRVRISITLMAATNATFRICYEWGLFSPRRISEDLLAPGNRIVATIVENRLGTAVTSLSLVN